MTPPQASLQDIEHWLEQHVAKVARIEPLVGDVSARRYFRIATDSGSSILAGYPPSMLDSCERFLETNAMLEGAGVSVPRVLASDTVSGFVWLEDLGPDTLYDLRDRPWTDLAPHFDHAIEHYRKILSLDRSRVEELNPILDGPWLDRELDLTFESLFASWSFFVSDEQKTDFRSFLSILCLELGQSPRSPCHRDYMARNLLVRGDELVVIDHQDLRLGPRRYDLASLLNDSLFPPREVEERILARVLEPGDDRRSYHLAAIQRTLKAAGTFTSFAARGRPRHLPLVRPTLERTLYHLDQLSEGRSWAKDLQGPWSAMLTGAFSRTHS